ncbi:hypothetical protein AB1K54_03875 [Microbacterium sp. BWT-B31]|uniref:hypothetical protein n=1 Tax=Microbacterium sp. BWT-B31 TaxID=3232072 RepID=UPI003528717C
MSVTVACAVALTNSAALGDVPGRPFGGSGVVVPAGAPRAASVPSATALQPAATTTPETVPAPEPQDVSPEEPVPPAQPAPPAPAPVEDAAFVDEASRTDAPSAAREWAAAHGWTTDHQDALVQRVRDAVSTRTTWTSVHHDGRSDDRHDRCSGSIRNQSRDSPDSRD